LHQAWERGSVAAWQSGSVAAWQHGSMAAWQHGSMEPFPANTRLGWKGLPGTNTVAYYGNL
jgi:hypothetical protein